ncbi:MAG: GntR family transcriptional regulator [Armatimonadia bacterium]
MIEELLAGRKLNKDSPIPYYYQLAQILRDAMDDVSASAEEGEEIPLPSEPMLAEWFKVTRGTVRHALEILEREGLIYREKGRGTFMRRRRVELNLTELSSITAHMRDQRWAAEYRLLGLDRGPARPQAQRALGLAEAEEVWEVRRLRLADSEPVSAETSIIPCRLAPDLQTADLTASLYQTLRSRYGFDLKTSEQTIRTRAADAEEAVLLNVHTGDPVFVITGVLADAQGTPVEYSRSLWRGDRYDLQVRLVSRE